MKNAEIKARKKQAEKRAKDYVISRGYKMRLQRIGITGERAKGILEWLEEAHRIGFITLTQGDIFGDTE